MKILKTVDSGYLCDDTSESNSHGKFTTNDSNEIEHFYWAYQVHLRKKKKKFNQDKSTETEIQGNITSDEFDKILLQEVKILNNEHKLITLKIQHV